MLGLQLALTPGRDRAPAPFPQSGLAAWYDPSDRASLWQDVARTVPVTADGQPVAAMMDRSGNGLHLTQASAAARPIYHTDGTLHWLSFDGIDDTLSCAAGPHGNPASFGLAFALDSFAATYANLMHSGSDMPRIYMAQGAPAQIRAYWGSGFLYVTRSASMTAIGPTSLLTEVNGTGATLNSGGQSATASGVSTNASAGTLGLGEGGFAGRIFAATYHYAAHDSAGRAALTAYLNASAGI